jgi:hypothetical protein
MCYNTNFGIAFYSFPTVSSCEIVHMLAEIFNGEVRFSNLRNGFVFVKLTTRYRVQMLRMSGGTLPPLPLRLHDLVLRSKHNFTSFLPLTFLRIA